MALSDSRENAGMPNDGDAREHAGHQHQEPVAELSETTDRALPSKNPEVLLSDIMQGLQGGSDEKLQAALRELTAAHTAKGLHEEDAKNLARVMKLLGTSEEHRLPTQDEQNGGSSAVLDVAKAMMIQKNKEVQQLQTDLAQRDEQVKGLEHELQQERERSKLLEKEMTALQVSSSDTSIQDELRQAQEKIHALEIENQHLVQGCDAAMGQTEVLTTTASARHEEATRRGKEELLEAIELIAKQENGLLRSIISQLKDEISQRIELHARETKVLQDALDETHRRYQGHVCGDSTGQPEVALEEELRNLGEELGQER